MYIYTHTVYTCIYYIVCQDKIAKALFSKSKSVYASGELFYLYTIDVALSVSRRMKERVINVVNAVIECLWHSLQ